MLLLPLPLETRLGIALVGGVGLAGYTAGMLTVLHREAEPDSAVGDGSTVGHGSDRSAPAGTD